MSDILADYREWADEHLQQHVSTHSDRCHLWHDWCMIHRLAAEVESLRELADKRGSIAVKRRREIERLRLTKEEREALDVSVPAILLAADELGLSQADCDRLIATLRGLLGRHFPKPENPPVQDNRPPASGNLPSGNDTPNLHSNQSEASVRPECAISPPWMARPCWVDPPEGWRYGFPKLYDPANNGDMNAWLIANGYPRYLADQNLPITLTAQIEH